jgi:hypothetical protein
MVNKARTSAFGANSITSDKISIKIDIPTISSVVYVGDDTATSTDGGQTVTINGKNFNSGCYVYLDTSIVTPVTYVSPSQVTFSAPAKSAGTYDLYVYNPDGGTAFYIPGVSYSGTPSWSTASGSIGTSYETVELSPNVTVLSASSNSTIRYRLFSGTLPSGSTLNANTGAITGISSLVSGVTTYSFSIEAYDEENQGVIRPFSITINPDVVTWSSPANGTTLTSYEYGSISQTFSASSAIGRSVAYAANTLPTGVTLSGNTVSGTPTVTGTINALITATAATSNKTATRNIIFQINPDVVTWSSPADGTTLTSYEYGSISQSLNATSATGRSISYSANTLPTGITMTGNTISGTPTVVGTNNSLITATSATTNRSASRNIIFQINPDVVTWSSPADGTTITSYEYGSISQSLIATSDTGRSISYSANTLPTGLTLSGNTISGTPTVTGTNNSLITATSNTTNRSSNRNIIFQINPDVVTWSSPADGTLINSNVGSSITQSLSATSATGRSITYTANTLPGGLSISGNNITGTLTTQANTTSLITATSATTNRTATRTLLFYVKTVPNAPTIGTATSTGTTTATVAFTAPVYDGNSPITQYIATSSPGNITGTLNQAGSGTINISGLTVGTSYTFTVRAVNAAGQSVASSASNSITTYSVPGAPTIGTATQTGQTTATVSFTAPASNGGATITSYTAVSSPGGVTGTLNQAGSGTISISGLTSGTSYTFTVYATNSVGNSPSSSSSNQITTAQILDGSTSARANSSAAAIKALTGTNTDGVYWINLPSVGPTEVYCIMNSAVSGGGWMMAMKATRGTTFPFSSSHWTSATTLNPSATNRSDGDAKFDSMNYYSANDIMAVFPDISTNGGSLGSNPFGCWTWLESNFNGSATTLINFFNTAGTYSNGGNPSSGNYGGKFIRDAKTFSGWQAGVFSSQADVRFYGFNYKNIGLRYGGNGCCRWGFGWNENGEGLYSSPETLTGGGYPGSNDVWGGIGMDTVTNYSAGDHVACCDDSRGINRSARVEIYIR